MIVIWNCFATITYLNTKCVPIYLYQLINFIVPHRSFICRYQHWRASCESWGLPDNSSLQCNASGNVIQINNNTYLYRFNNNVSCNVIGFNYICIVILSPKFDAFSCYYFATTCPLYIIICILLLQKFNLHVPYNESTWTFVWNTNFNKKLDWQPWQNSEYSVWGIYYRPLGVEIWYFVFL